MKLKIIAIGDLHLGFKMYDLVERIKDHADVLPQINDYIDEYKPDVVILLGDVFNSPNPDSYSINAFREFIDKIPLGATIIGLTGNHDRERIDLGMTHVRGIGGSRVLLGEGLFVTKGVKIRAFDWMPAAAMTRELEQIKPGDYDIICYHQSTEGLLPTIGNPEVLLSQIAGKAPVILVGDVHLNKTVRTGLITEVFSCGSTEMCKSDEDPNKSVKLIVYDGDLKEVTSVTDLKLSTRKFLQWEISTEEDFKYALERIGEIEDDGIKYLHRVFISNEFSHRTPELKAAAKAAGSLITVDPLVQIVEDEQSFLQSKESAEDEMEEIIADRHKDDELERTAAVSLWNNPNQLEAILETIK